MVVPALQVVGMARMAMIMAQVAALLMVAMRMDQDTEIFLQAT
jgi:hypothetical protein